MADIAHLDAPKRHDVVFFQRHVLGNFIRLLEKAKAGFVKLPARHDAWTARLEAEARRPPKDEAERLQRVRNFLFWRGEFEEESSEHDHYGHGTSVEAGRRLPRPRGASAPAPRPPRPATPGWVAEGEGLRDINGNFRIERTRCSSAHLEYFMVRLRHGDSWVNVAEKATLSEATEHAEDMLADE